MIRALVTPALCVLALTLAGAGSADTAAKIPLVEAMVNLKANEQAVFYDYALAVGNHVNPTVVRQDVAAARVKLGRVHSAFPVIRADVTQLRESYARSLTGSRRTTALGRVQRISELVDTIAAVDAEIDHSIKVVEADLRRGAADKARLDITTFQALELRATQHKDAVMAELARLP